MPGVAANVVGLAYIAAGQGRRGDALALIEEAGAIAAASEAYGIMCHVEEAGAQMLGDRQRLPAPRARRVCAQLTPGPVGRLTRSVRTSA